MTSSSTILTFKSNASALSHHRLNKLLQIIHSQYPEFQGTLSAHWIYFVQLGSSSSSSSISVVTTPTLTENQFSLLQDLLQASFVPGEFSLPVTSPPSSLFVYPRLGTLSSWSSKATDIAHVCGLTNLRRVERGTLYTVTPSLPLPLSSLDWMAVVKKVVVDPMMESVFTPSTFPNPLSLLLDLGQPRALITVPIRGYSDALLEQLGHTYGLGLSVPELRYVADFFANQAQRDPTDAELMMYAQVNSEHCRHKLFNATWEIDQKVKEKTLFEMIKNTYHESKAHILSAYSDNAAVLEGPVVSRFAYTPNTQTYGLPVENDPTQAEPVHMVIKVETHNHPTGVSPHPGASTGTGGEIRDEGSVGQGSQSKAGLTGFTVNALHIPGFIQPWEKDHLATDKTDSSCFSSAGVSSLDIMLQAPLGAASFGNEFGRPNLAGYFRTFSFDSTTTTSSSSVSHVRWGFQKPIMLAGGMGQIRPMHVHKQPLFHGCLLIVLGGPCMLIGLGGGAASSVSAGTSAAHLDFASVQRANPEMQRRCQLVIDQCTALGSENPILAIHDVGAGGLSNALPELVHDAGLGARIELRSILCDDTGLSPMEIWCNESQERYVLGLPPSHLPLFQSLCKRERCPFAVVGTATEQPHLIVHDSLFGSHVVDVPMDFLFTKPPRLYRSDVTLHRPTSHSQLLNAFHSFCSVSSPFASLSVNEITSCLKEAVTRVLQFPAVADKSFLIHIADRFVGGLTTRDQCVGKWQVPVADVAVISTTFETWFGEAMALGERPPLAVLSPTASARMAVGEAILNLLAAHIESLSHVRLSANWMAAVKEEGEGSAIYAAVETLGLSLCPDLQIAIPVGKDSLSMKSKDTVSPLSLNVTAYAVVKDTRLTFTPCLRSAKVDEEETVLLFIDLSGGTERLGGSTLCQVFNCLREEEPPNFEDVPSMRAVWKLLQSSFARKHVLAYHDRSDGGLFTTITEMCFAARMGFQWILPRSICNPPTMNLRLLLSYLFNEELGVVVQLSRTNVNEFCDFATSYGLNKDLIHVLGSVQPSSYQLSFVMSPDSKDEPLISFDLFELRALWSSTSRELKNRRDHPNSALEEFQAVINPNDVGLFSHLTFNFPLSLVPSPSTRPKVAILREQGVNSYLEMAYSFHAAGFTSVDVHMTDLLQGKVDLSDFVGLAACGGFSFGDVLGAGRGWAMSILGNEKLRKAFQTFFATPTTFALGICNGCQMFSHLRDLFPDPSSASLLPYFDKNMSDQFEARTVMVEVVDSKSIFFQSMAGTCLPIPVAHGEGYTRYTHSEALTQLQQHQMTALRYIEKPNTPTEVYPFNPNGSPEGWTGFTSLDGRITLIMPHPERATRWVGQSWIADEWVHPGYHGPWLKMFENARRFVG